MDARTESSSADTPAGSGAGGITVWAVLRRLGPGVWLLVLSAFALLAAAGSAAVHTPWIDRGADTPTWYEPEGLIAPVAHDFGWLGLVSRSAWRAGDVTPIYGAGGLGGAVWTVAFSPDGTRIVSGGADGTVRLWTLDGFAVGKPLRGHEGWVRSVDFSPDGTRIVSGGDDGTVRLWTLEGAAVGEPLRGHEGTVSSVDFSPDGTRIVSGGSDGTVRLWTVDRAAVGESLRGQEGMVWSVDFAREGATAWTRDGAPVLLPEEQGGPVLSVGFSPDGTRIVAGGSDNTVRLWTVDGAEVGEPLRGHEERLFVSVRFSPHAGIVPQGNAMSVDFSPDGMRIVSGGDDGTVRLWTLEGAAVGEPLRGHEGTISSVDFSPDGTRIVSGGSDGTVRLWTLDGAAVGEPLRGHEGSVMSVDFSSDGTRIVSGGQDGTVRFWTLDGAAVGEPLRGHEDEVRSVDFSPDGTRIVSGGDDGAVRLWTLDGVAVGEPLRGHEGIVWSVGYSPGGTRIVSGGDDGTVRLWTLDGVAVGEPLRGHEGSVVSVGFSPDGTRIVSGGQDGAVRLWRVDGAAVGEPLRGHESWVLSIDFSQDGTRIVSGSTDGSVRLWTVDGAAVGELLRAHDDWVWSVGFSSDGTRIVSGGGDGTVRLWTLDGAAVGEPLRGHEGEIRSVGFSPDGTRIVSGGADGTVRLWTLDGSPLLVFRVSFIGVASVASNDVGTVATANGAGQIHIFKPEPTFLLPPPWTWPAAGFSLALLGAASVAWRRAATDLRREAASREQRVPAAAAFLDAEGPLERPDLAGPAMAALVRRLSGFIRNRDTATPFTFALAGEWGSGKSSVMRLLQDDLERSGFPTIWFNVWHHQNEEHLFAALMEAIRTEAAPSLMSFSAYRWHPLAFRRRLLVERMQAHPLRYALQLAVAIFFVILLWKLVPTVDMRTLPAGLLKLTDQGIVLVKLAASLGAFWLALRELVLPFNVKPGALLASTDGWLGTRSFNDRLGFRQTFATAFGEVTRAMGDRRLTILIDDLDRCRPDRVVDLLEAVNFLTSNGNCFVVLGLSEGPVTAAIGLSFKEIADERVRSTRRRGRQAKPAAAARLDFARNYLEKLVTLRVPVPAFDGAALRNWLDNGGLQARSAGPSGWREFARALPLMLCFGCFAIGAALLALEVAGPIGRTWDTAPTQQTEAAPAPQPGQAGVPAPAPQAGDGAATAPVNPAGDPRDDLQRRRPDRGYVAPAAPHWTASLHWLAAALLLVVPLLLLSPSCRRYVFGWMSGVESGVRRDSDEYRRAFGLWAPLVLSSRGSPRAIKRFANRMRYLTSDVEVRGNEGKIAALVALGALDEAGLLDAARGVEQLATLRHFGTIEALDAEMLPAIGAIAPADWDDYWARTGTPMASAPATPSPPAAE